MRGGDGQQAGMFSYVSPERRIPADHPLRPIREMTDTVLRQLSPRFARLYPKTGRPSVAPERLLRALLLQVHYSVRSERLLMEQLEYNLLLRRLASTLRATGVAVTFAKSGQRAITLEKVGNFSPTASLASNRGSPLDGTDAPLDAKDARSGAPYTRPGAEMDARDAPDANPPLRSHEREPGEEG
jgi:hypothetical protein